MSELKWKWAYGPYLDPPEGQKESAIKAGYVKVVSKQSVDAAIAELEAKVKFCCDFELAARKDIEEMRGQHQMLKQFGHYKLSPVPGKMINHEVRQYVSYNVVCMIINHLESENAELKDKCQMHDFFWEGCGFEKRGFKNTIAVREAFDRLEAENRRLRKALWLARANMARGLAEMCEHQFDCCGVSRSRFLVGWDKKSKPKRMTTTEWGELWRKVEQKCRAKAEEYK